MSDVLGNNLKITIFGESHGPYIGGTLIGLPSGIKINESFIKEQLNKRKANDIYSTSRQEDDEFQIISGVFQGYTTGEALTLIIPNKKQDSSAYKERLIRPSHADYTSFVKYQGFNDPRGGGHFSGRLTAPLVGLGAIIIAYLQEQGIKIASHIKEIHGVKDDEFDFTNLENTIDQLNSSIFPCINKNKEDLMKKEIMKARENQDSVGGTIETIIVNVKPGLGNPFFDSLESELAHALFSIPGFKGLEFGLGFAFKDYYGSEVNDALRVEKQKIITSSNHNGGINGGITNGMPIIFRSVLKPTPSISKPQESISLDPLANKTIEIHGRHDPCIVRRGLVVINALSAFVLLDQMLSR